MDVEKLAEMTMMNATAPNVPLSDRAEAEDAWLDEALAGSFPASDPLPWRHTDTAPAQEADAGADSSVMPNVAP